MQIDKEDAEQGGDGGVSFPIQKEEDGQYEDADYFNSGALFHSVRDVIDEIDQIAAHGQYDKRIQLPKARLGVFGRRQKFPGFQIVLGIGLLKNIPKILHVQYFEFIHYDKC